MVWVRTDTKGEVMPLSTMDAPPRHPRAARVRAVTRAPGGGAARLVSALVRAAVALGAVAFAVGLTLAPRGVVAPARELFMRGLDGLLSPFVGALHFGDLERTLNALMFAPLGFAVALVLPRRLWIAAPLTGLLVSAVVELMQAQIPGRVSDPNDVLWNTLGALAGAVLALVARVAVSGRRRRG